MNEYDSNRIFDIVKEIGYEKSQNPENVDCFVINTCHIRDKAKEKVFHEVGRIKKIYSNKIKPIMVVAGCVAQAENQEMIKREPYIDIVIGPQSYHKINKILKNFQINKKDDETEFDTIAKFDLLQKIKNSESKVSSFLTIQEGCNKFCKFCVVPYTRGAEYSRSIIELVQECKSLVSNGAKEITLLGQNVNAYNFKGKRLSDLIKEISKIKNLKRIRYTTSHPIDFTEDLIKIHNTSEKLMPLIHLPVQSGSNKILKMMNRKHTIKDYLNIITKLKMFKKNIQFSSDFIIGYPGETEKDFNETVKLMRKVEFINSYSFIFSARPGTPAAKMQQVEEDISKKRLIIFQKVAEEIKMKYRKNLLGKKRFVLFENKVTNKNQFFGRDEFSNSVIVKSEDDLQGKINEVTIIDVNQNTLFGEINTNINEKEFAA